MSTVSVLFYDWETDRPLQYADLPAVPRVGDLLELLGLALDGQPMCHYWSVIRVKWELAPPEPPQVLVFMVSDRVHGAKGPRVPPSTGV